MASDSPISPLTISGIRSVTRKTPITECLFVGGTFLLPYAVYSKRELLSKRLFVHAACATRFAPQGSVVSETKSHALFLTIHLDPQASPQECLKSIGQIKKYVDAICPPDSRSEEDEILYGVGFGFEFLQKINPNYQSRGINNYEYRERSGNLGKLPKTDGDIFIHAKCHEYGKLFELTQAIINNLPNGSVIKFEDIYGWVYRNGRDLSGFIDDHTKEGWIGRTLKDSIELKNKPITSHVARMVGSADYDAPSKYKIVRQSQPYGTLSGDAGLLFIAYAADTKNFDFMLDRMTGDSEDRKNDDVMRFTKCVTGNYWYFPSVPEFDRLVGGGLWGFW
ncbi:unnamed protein product [Schistosoma curassoni]|uniref:Deferrochelatase/peroxidase YfeX n=1 Tax=Schistosoma curassoni TaxID=6186 RepID=A0A183K4E9_9TREM|nr:unnamed protein product [Schistosoma curassoni]